MQPENNLKSHLWPCPAAVLLNLKKKKRKKSQTETKTDKQKQSIQPMTVTSHPSFACISERNCSGTQILSHGGVFPYAFEELLKIRFVFISK